MAVKVTYDKLVNAIIVMREHLPNKFHMKPPATTKALGVSGGTLKLHLNCNAWAEVYERFVYGTEEVPSLHEDNRVTKPKRLNPETGLPFSKGEIDDTGRYFSNYLLKENNSQYPEYCREFWWDTFEKFKKKQIEDAFTKSRKNAKKRGLEWDLSPKRISELVEKEHCANCGTRMRMPWEDHPRRKKGPATNSFSIDRIDNEIGYFDYNVEAMCTPCNTGKGRLTRKQIIQLVDYTK